MQEMESIKELINNNKNIKCYPSLESSKDIAIVIAAYANSEGGYIAFGVNRILSKNVIVGLASDYRVNIIVGKIDESFNVKPEYVYKWMKVENKHIFVIRVHKSQDEILVNQIKYEMREKEIIKIKEMQKMDFTKVFIVHGHDNEAKQELARYIEKLGITAIILHEQVNKGSTTIIEKIEEYSNVGFGIALYTACDEGKAKDESTLKKRARQNVVFEHGFLMGKLGRKKVCALVKGDLETPNDISGVVYISMDNNGAWKMNIAQELNTVGYDIDFNKIFK